MPREFEIPDILNEDADAIHDRMLESAPSHINLVEGDFYWDATRPTAESNAELIQVKLFHVLKMAFPQTSYGQLLEFLGEMKGVFKHPATRSTGLIVVTGKEGTVMRRGHIIGTAATDEEPSIEFTLDHDIVIDSSETSTGTATCMEYGLIGNVSKNTIKVLNESISGIQSINNPEDFKSGTEIEDEEDFRDRVLEAYRNEPLSGAKRDYERWAKEVPGVGNVYIKPEWDGPGTVKILALDSNGRTASEVLLKEIRLHIIGQEEDGKNENDDGLAPIGAFITVDTPDTLDINISANFIIDSSFTIENIIKDIEDHVGRYLQGVDMGGVVTYKAIDGLIGSMIIRREGILDYSNLTMNGEMENIQLGDEVASIGEVVAL